jgi:hypothetical protein
VPLRKPVFDRAISNEELAPDVEIREEEPHLFVVRGRQTGRIGSQLLDAILGHLMCRR